MSPVEKLSLICNRYTERGLLVLGLSMTVIVITQVIFRYILNHSLFWSEELARYILVWLTFLGASVAYYRGMHPGVDLLYRYLPARGKRYSRVAVYTISLVLFSIMIWYGSQFSHFVRMQTTPALSLPKWTIFSVIPISGVILSIHALAFLRREVFPSSQAP